MIKQIILFTAICASWIGSFAQNQKKSPKLKLEEETYTFDTLEYGQECTHDFVFTNAGDEPLVLFDVSTACGCDVASWNKEPVKPGEKNKATYKYDSKRVGHFSKTMRLTGNFEGGEKIIAIKGYVRSPRVLSSVAELKNDLQSTTYQQKKENEDKKKTPVKKKKLGKKSKHKKPTYENKMD